MNGQQIGYTGLTYISNLPLNSLPVLNDETYSFMADSYRIAFLLLELTFMFNSEYIECIVHTYQYESNFVRA